MYMVVIVVLICCRNWKTFDDRTIDFCQGITLHHLPGHTDGELRSNIVAIDEC
jgi:hypothetical protein